MVLERFATVKTPLPPDLDGNDALEFAFLRGYDRISQCFRLELGLASFDPDVESEKLLGEGISVAIAGQNAGETVERFFHGIVDQFHFDGDTEGERYIYRLILRPAFWFLSKTTDNKIFQKMTVPDIVEEVLGEGGVAEYKIDLAGSYPEREYCVQYGESDLDFVQRLLEHEGIFYYFEYEDGLHRMVICDDLGKLKPPEGCGEIEFEPRAVVRTGEMNVITRLDYIHSAVSAKYTHTDYDFEKPSADLMTSEEAGGKHTLDEQERYAYPGNYVEHRRGKSLSGVRIDETRGQTKRMVARSTAVAPFSGHKFKIFGSPRESQNDEFFVHRCDYNIWEGQYFAGHEAADQGFEAVYELIPAASQYRPPRQTPKPVMKGPQTAVVVGPGGEEIHTDEYARVKVQFHWDRLGGKDENSTCFIRVSSAWAGAGWGFIQIPRIGQEVIVDFLEGDPDRPIVTGRVYNAEQMPPYELPANATQSGWKSNSSKGGGGWNEMRFEDKKGEEEVYFQAEKDHNELVKNNESRTIGHDFFEDIGNDATQNVHHDRTETVDNNKSTTVGVDRTVSIGSNDTESVGVNRSLSVGADETISVGSNSSETIGANHTQKVGMAQSITVGAARVDSVGAAETRSVGAAQSNQIGASRSMTVGAGQSHRIGAEDEWTIGGDQKTDIGGNQTFNLKGDQSWTNEGGRLVKVGKGQTHDVAEDVWIKAGKDMLLEAADSITLKCGSAAISMKKDGTINIEGKDITTKGSGKINIKASKDVTVKGSKINNN